jgi:erythronate-4-phosphate dehydrogenase
MDEIELESAIERNILLATVLDVWRNEPLINLHLLEKITLATPHIAGYSADGKAKGTEMSVRALSAAFNLGISDWTPSHIPLPEYPLIKINCLNKSEQEIISEAYQHAYAIASDDANLRKNADLFETLRGNYPIRREAKAYCIELKGNFSSLVKYRLLRIGFFLK